MDLEQAQKPYRVELSELALKGSQRLLSDDWAVIAKELARVAELAGRLPPPPRELLEEAGFSPPLLRLPVGGELLLYEFDHAIETLRVLALLHMPPANGVAASS